MTHQPDNIFAGTQVVALTEVRGPHRDQLLAVKRGELSWAEVDAWRKQLHHDFERALAETRLPERPNCEMANEFLIQARRQQVKSSPSLNSQLSTVNSRSDNAPTTKRPIAS